MNGFGFTWKLILNSIARTEKEYFKNFPEVSYSKTKYGSDIAWLEDIKSASNNATPPVSK